MPDDEANTARNPKSEHAPRCIIHVDMDAFFASVEQRDRPETRSRPVLVGGTRKRGVVAAASYEARAFGIHSAMPMAEALRRCPHAIVLPGHYARYQEASRAIFAIFRRFTPLVEGLSLDEAFLDVTHSLALFGDGESIATRIRTMIADETQLTASAGVASSKFVAKIASDLHKPDGLTVVTPEQALAFLAPLPVERMWGVGRRTAPRAKQAGFHTLGDLAAATDEHLRAVFGRWGPAAKALARGEDAREVVPERAAKSLGAEETFEHNLRDPDALRVRLLAQAERVAGRLVMAGLVAGSISVKLKHTDFTVKTRTQRLPEPVQDTDAIYRAACTALDRFLPLPLDVRLTGVSASDLRPVESAQTLFPDPDRARGRKLEAVRADLSSRFRSGILTRAALLDAKRPKPGGGSCS